MVEESDSIDLEWGRIKLTGRVERRIPDQRGDTRIYPAPDLALIVVNEPLNHPSAWLADPDDHLVDNAVVTAHGFSRNTTQEGQLAKDACLLRIAGRVGDGCLRVIGDRVPRGMSGGFVIDTSSSRVVGLVKASVDDGGVQAAGGWIVPVSALATEFPGAVDANRRACSAWREAADPGHLYLAEMFAKADPPGIVDQVGRAPSYYLEPLRRITRFLTRPELTTLTEWCRSDTGPVVRLVAGPGGTGKTRLGAELIQQMRTVGWAAGWLPPREMVDLGQLATALAERDTLLCVDDSEEWAYVLPKLLEKRAGRRDSRVRILFFARTAGAWWTNLRSGQSARSLVAPKPIRLGQLGEHVDRSEILDQAYQDFRAAVYPAAPARTPAVLLDAAPAEANVLVLHAAALSVVLSAQDNDGVVTDEALDLRSPLDDMVGHERDWWESWIRSSGPEPNRSVWREPPTRDFSSRVLAVVALYLADDVEQAKAALDHVLAEGREPAEPAGTTALTLTESIAHTLQDVYPRTRENAPGIWSPLRPDPLAETLVLEVLDEAISEQRCVNLVSAIFEAGVDERQAEHALDLLCRISGLTDPLVGAQPAEQRAAACVRTMLERFPRAFLPAAVTVAARRGAATPLIDVIRTALQHANGELPRRVARTFPREVPGLATLEAALWERCIALSEEQFRAPGATERLDRADQYGWLSEAYEAAGNAPAARAAASAAVALYAEVVHRGRPDTRVALAHAHARERLSHWEQEADNPREALELITHAVHAYTDLVAAGNPYEAEVIRASKTRERLLRGMGRNSDADLEVLRRDGMVSAYRRSVENFLDLNLPRPTGVQSEVGNGLPTVDQYEGPRPSFGDRDLRIVLPTGHFAGPMHTSAKNEIPESFEVRFREGVYSLSAEEYAVWAVSHGDPYRVGMLPQTREVVEYSARLAGVEEPSSIFDSLVADGLLVEIPPVGESAVARGFASHHRVIPLALGLGNSSHAPAEFQIGLPNAPRVSVGYDVYHMWLFSHRSASLWESVDQIAQEAADSNKNIRDPDASGSVHLVADPDVLLTALLRALPVLVSTSCVFLDRL